MLPKIRHNDFLDQSGFPRPTRALRTYASYETLREKFDLAIGGVEAAIGRE